MKNTHISIALLGFLIVFISPVNGQKPYTLDKSTTTFIDNALMECMYNYTVKAHPWIDPIDKTVSITYNTLLQANATVSKFWDWHTFKKDSLIFTSVSPLPTDSFYRILTVYDSRVKYLYIPVIFKNYPKGNYTVIDDIAPNMYIYEQPRAGLVWSLKDDTMTVCGYLCNKAVGTYGGRDWTAWYANEITISDGPWKLYGLPGLILKAVDATGEHAFEAVEIRNADHPIYLTNDIERLKIGKEKFFKQKQAFDKDPFGNIKMNPTISGVTIVMETIVLINGKHTSVLVDVFYSPIELK